MKRVTPAEKRALDAMARYGSVKAAAFALGKSPHTVTRQLDSARRRLGAESSMQAYAMSREPI
jgi:DNA-binding NarL/FixJ family response regulator